MEDLKSEIVIAWSRDRAEIHTCTTMRCCL